MFNTDNDTWFSDLDQTEQLSLLAKMSAFRQTINQISPDGLTPLTKAAQSGTVEEIKNLLELGASRWAFNGIAKNSVITAIDRDDPDIFDAVMTDVSTEEFTSEIDGLLEIAVCYNGPRSLHKILERATSELSQEGMVSILNLPDRESGHTLAQTAIINRFNDCLSLLFEYGASPFDYLFETAITHNNLPALIELDRQTNGRNSLVPRLEMFLGTALEPERAPMFKWLVGQIELEGLDRDENRCLFINILDTSYIFKDEKSFEIGLKHFDFCPATVLNMLITGSDQETARSFFVLVAKPFAGAALAQLYKAYNDGDIQMINQLLGDHHLNATSSQPETTPEKMLIEAVANGNIQFTKKLLERGADVNQADANGMTALHAVVMYADDNVVPIAKLLLDHDADRSRVDILGDTPYDKVKGDKELEDILKNYGVFPKIPSPSPMPSKKSPVPAPLCEVSVAASAPLVEQLQKELDSLKTSINSLMVQFERVEDLLLGLKN